MKTQIQDEYGEKIGMSRRDMARLAKMADIGEKLAELDDYQREYFFKTATRDFLWPKFDWGKFDPERHDLGRELLLHQIRKCLPLQCGETDDGSRSDFVRNVTETMRLAGEMARSLGGDDFDMAYGVFYAVMKRTWNYDVCGSIRRVYYGIGFEIEKARLLGFPEFRDPAVLDMRSRVVFDDGYDKTRPWCLQRSPSADFGMYDTKVRHFESIDALKEHLAGKRKKTDKGNKNPRRPQFEKIVRNGFFPDTASIDNEELISRFGLRGYEYGSWLGQEDRGQSLLWAVDSFADLAKTIGIPESAIGNGNLGLGFGSRGHGGRAEAHYEKTHNVINLTKMKGAGALAHEWGHYLDLRVMPGLSGSAYGFMNKLTHRMPRNDAEKITAYRQSESGQKSERALFTWLDSERKREYVRARLNNAASAGEYVDVIREVAQREILEERDNAVAAQSWLDTLDAKRRHIDNFVVETDFYRNSRKIGSKYWSDPQELWARAFEYYVSLKMSLAGMRNDYLVGLYEDGLAYPPAHEARIVFDVMEKAMEMVRRSLGVEERISPEFDDMREKLAKLPLDPEPELNLVEVPDNPWDDREEKPAEDRPEASDSIYLDDDFETDGQSASKGQSPKPWFF